MPKFPSDRVALLRLILSTNNNNKFWIPSSKKPLFDGTERHPDSKGREPLW